MIVCMLLFFFFFIKNSDYLHQTSGKKAKKRKIPRRYYKRLLEKFESVSFNNKNEFPLFTYTRIITIESIKTESQRSKKKSTRPFKFYKLFASLCNGIKNFTLYWKEIVNFSTITEILSFIIFRNKERKEIGKMCFRTHYEIRSTESFLLLGDRADVGIRGG